MSMSTQIINFGSLNIDHVYRVETFVRPGETIHSLAYQQFAGGKGFNQSIALARAGAPVHHAGKIGPEGGRLLDILIEAGARTEHIVQIDTPTGHALIQVDSHGENAIILYGGANQTVAPTDVTRVLSHFGDGDYLLLQNEISQMDEILRQGRQRGLQIVLNPAPMTRTLLDYPLDAVSVFIVNETEGEALTGESQAEAILDVMRRRYPQASTVLTLGGAGAHYTDSKQRIHVPAVEVEAIDTTAAGDTFTGYFLAGIIAGDGVDVALGRAARAAAICVTRPGAASSIPTLSEVENFAGSA